MSGVCQKAWEWPNCDKGRKKVLCSGQTKMEPSGQNSKHCVWWKPKAFHASRLTIPTVKYSGGSIMLCGCFWSAGTGHLVRIEGRSDGAKYRGILQEETEKTAWEEIHLSAEQWSQGQGQSDFGVAQEQKCPTVARSKSWSQSRVGSVGLFWKLQSVRITQTTRMEEWAKVTPALCAKLVHAYPKNLKLLLQLKATLPNINARRSNTYASKLFHFYYFSDKILPDINPVSPYTNWVSVL